MQADMHNEANQTKTNHTITKGIMLPRNRAGPTKARFAATEKASEGPDPRHREWDPKEKDKIIQFG